MSSARPYAKRGIRMKKYFNISVILGIIGLILIARCFKFFIIPVYASFVLPILLLICIKYYNKLQSKKYIRIIINTLAILTSVTLNAVFVAIAWIYIISLPPIMDPPSSLTSFKFEEVTDKEVDNIKMAEDTNNYNEWIDIIVNKEIGISEKAYLYGLTQDELNNKKVLTYEEISQIFGSEDMYNYMLDFKVTVIKDMKVLPEKNNFNELMNLYKKELQATDNIYNIKNMNTNLLILSVERYTELFNFYLRNYYYFREEDKKIMDSKLDYVLNEHSKKFQKAVLLDTYSQEQIASTFNKAFNWPLYDYNRDLHLIENSKDILITGLNSKKLNFYKIYPEEFSLGKSIFNQFTQDNLAKAHNKSDIGSLKTRKNIINYLNNKNNIDVILPYDVVENKNVKVTETENQIIFEIPSEKFSYEPKLIVNKK